MMHPGMQHERGLALLLFCLECSCQYTPYYASPRFAVCSSVLTILWPWPLLVLLSLLVSGQVIGHWW